MIKLIYKVNQTIAKGLNETERDTSHTDLLRNSFVFLKRVETADFYSLDRFRHNYCEDNPPSDNQMLSLKCYQQHHTQKTAFVTPEHVQSAAVPTIQTWTKLRPRDATREEKLRGAQNKKKQKNNLSS